MNLSIRIQVIFIFSFGFFLNLKGQSPANLSLVPPSPEMTSLGNYGNIGVSNYTGRVNVSVPIYDLQTTDFKLPISLSYNTGGIKVEEIASWVGLGWSLNAGGIITRGVRGKPDEQANGYMNPNVEYTVQEIFDMPIENPRKEELFTQIYDGYIDTEPDIFYFNFAGYSGKFHFDQNSGKMVFVPFTPFWIDIDLFLTQNKWHIITDDGTEYFFELAETNTTYTACNGVNSTPDLFASGWFLTKIITPIEKDQILFNYSPLLFQTNNIAKHTLNSGNGVSGLNCVQQIVRCNSSNNYNGYKLNSITWKNIKIEFNANTERLDLPETYQLDNIKIYDKSVSVSSKVFNFEYEYSQANLQLPVDELRLKLKSLTESTSSGKSKPPYSFAYNNATLLPSRLGYAQDIWGYYNKAQDNDHLVPPLQDKVLSTLNLLDGANRNVNSDYTDAEILTRINYPTGGYTQFDYENNTIATTDALPFSENKYQVYKSVFLDINDRQGSSEVFSEMFTINDKRSLGGVYLRIRVAGIFNCEYCPTASSCAVMNITGMGNTNGFPIKCDLDNYFLPNGNYVLKADFQGHTNPDDYGEFVIMVSYIEDESPYPVNVKVGGLRIVKMTDVVISGENVTTNFEYNREADLLSSGIIPSNQGIFERIKSCWGGGGGESFYVERKSNSFTPLSVANGSVVGYSRVGVKNGSDLEGGKTYSHYSQYQDDTYPGVDVYDSEIPLFLEILPIPISLDHRRGLLVKEEKLKWVDGIYSHIKIKEIDYSFFNTIYNYDFSEFVGNNLLFNETLAISTDKTLMPDGVFAEAIGYKVLSEMVKPVEIREYSFGNENGTLLKTTNYEYSNLNHLQPTSIITNRSNGILETQHLAYPLDYNLPNVTITDQATLGIKKLQDLKIKNQVIEQYSTIFDPATSNTSVVSGKLNIYKKYRPVLDSFYSMDTDFNASPFVPSNITAAGVFVKDQRFNSPTRLKYAGNSGRIIEVQREDNLVVSYLWGYDHKYVIAEILNADYQTVISKVSDAELQSLDGQTLRDRIETLRTDIPEAQITSFTYDLSYGLLSKTDPNGQTTIYEYDALGRLILIKDNKGKTLQMIDYNYYQN